MSQENNAPAQQTPAPEVPTGQAAGPQGQVPAQQASPPPDGTDYRARFTGLQQAHQMTVEQLRAEQERLQQLERHSQTVETQLNIALQERQSLQAAQQTLQAQLEQAQREQSFLSLITSEFPSLVSIAPYVQRVSDVDAQREILTNLASAIGNQTSQQARQQVEQAFQGATPGTTPQAGGAPTGQPSYGEIMEHVLDNALASRDPETWNRWYQIYRNSPETGPQSLGRTFVDPFQTDYHAMQTLNAARSGRAPSPSLPNQIDAGTGIDPGVWGGNPNSS